MREALRAYYDMGQEALLEFPKKYAPHGQFAPFAARFDVEPDTLRKARAFARLFSAKDLEAVLHPEGQPVSWAHVRLLVSVNTREERMQLVREILRNGWTARQLAAEIVHRRPGGRTRLGRRRRILTVPEGEKQALLLAATREYLATIAPQELAEMQLKESSEENLEQLLTRVMKHARRLRDQARVAGGTSLEGP
ncbi:hypothetical protein AYO47_02095 [Planctomyces sp. SCGC AG-212-M04]|nr:hypothetical protein AYO47_02095 [Planctomyces sp. SCGC AG-212-M04]